MSFNVTKKHIEEWYEENRWWADDLNTEEKIRLCKLFYIYQVVHQQRNPEIEIQSDEVRFSLSKKLADELNIKKYKDLTSAVMTPLPHPSTAKILQPFYSKYEDIERLVKDETVDILQVNSIDLNDIQNAQYKININEIYEETHLNFSQKYYDIDDNETLNEYLADNDDENPLNAPPFLPTIRKQLSILYGFCLIKIAYSIDLNPNAVTLPFITYLKSMYPEQQYNIDNINSTIELPNNLKQDRNELIRQVVYNNLFRYFTEKQQIEIPCLVRIYYEIVHNAECLYYGNISKAYHPFFVANMENRKIDINGKYDNKYPSNYRTVYYYWAKIIDKKNFQTNIEDFRLQFLNKSRTTSSFEEFLDNYYFSYTTLSTKNSNIRKIVIKIETQPSLSLLKKKDFVDELSERYLTKGFFNNASASQLSHFYDYLESDIYYKTKFIHNDEKGSDREGVFLDKNKITNQIDLNKITFNIFEKYLTGITNVDQIFDKNNIVNNKIIMTKIVQQISNWSKMNSHQGMDGGIPSRSDDDDDGGMINDGMIPARPPDSIQQSIMNVLHKHSQNVADHLEIRDYYIRFHNDTLVENRIDARTAAWDTPGTITRERMNSINIAFIDFVRETRPFNLSLETVESHTILDTDIYNEDVVKDVLLASGLILTGLKLPVVNGILINGLYRNTIIEEPDENPKSINISTTNMIRNLSSTYSYTETFGRNFMLDPIPQQPVRNTVIAPINIVNVPCGAQENCFYRHKDPWIDTDYRLFEKIILHKAYKIRRERNQRTFMTNIFEYAPGKNFLIVVLILVISYLVWNFNSPVIKNQEIMRLDNYTNVTVLNGKSLVELHHLRNDISRQKDGSELIKKFVKKVVNCHKLIAIYDLNLLEVSYAYWLIKNHTLNIKSFSPEDIEISRKILGENQLFNPDGSLKQFAPLLTLEDIDECFRGVESSYSKLTDKFVDNRVKIGNFNFTIEHFKILGEGTFTDLNSKKTRLQIKSRKVFNIVQSGSEIETTKKISGECNVGTFTETISSNITEECKSGTFTELTKKMTDEYNDKLTKNSKALVTMTNTTGMMPYKDYFENFLKLSGKKEEETFWYTPIMNLINYYLNPKKTYHTLRFDSSSINFQNWKKMYNDGFTDNTDQVITYQMFFELFKYINSTQFNDEKILNAIQTSINSREPLTLGDTFSKRGLVLDTVYEKGLVLKEKVSDYFKADKDEDEDEEYLTPLAKKFIKRWDNNEDNSTSTSTIEEISDGRRRNGKKSLKKYYDGSKKNHKKSLHKKRKSRHSSPKKDGKKSKKHRSQKKEEEKKKDKKKSRKN